MAIGWLKIIFNFQSSIFNRAKPEINFQSSIFNRAKPEIVFNRAKPEISGSAFLH